MIYFPCFIEGQKGTEITNAIYNNRTRWTQVRGRRLQNYGGVPHANGMVTERLPKFIDEIITRIKSFSGERDQFNCFTEFL